MSTRGHLKTKKLAGKAKSKPKKLREQLNAALTKLEELKTQLQESMPGNCSIVARFVKTKLSHTESRKDILRLKDAWCEYKEYIIIHNLQNQRLSYAEFAENMEQHLGNCVAKSGAMRRFWRGWII